MKQITFKIANENYCFEVHQTLGFPFFNFYHNGERFFVSPAPGASGFEKANTLYFRDKNDKYVKSVKVDWAAQYLSQIGLTAIEYKRNPFTEINAIYIKDEKVETFELIDLAKIAFEKVTKGVSKIKSSKIGEGLKISVEDFSDYENIEKDERPKEAAFNWKVAEKGEEGRFDRN